jgi:hypothetical protein
MATWTEWLREWRQIAETLREGYYEQITMHHREKDYDVLRVSLYDADLDGERRVVRTPIREFDDKVALFTRRTRDIGLVRVIAVRGRPRYVLEPGADALEWAADIEGVSLRELTQSVREGALGRRVARLANRQERRSREIVEAQVQALRERVEDVEAEAAMLKAELHARERDLNRYRED